MSTTGHRLRQALAFDHGFAAKFLAVSIGARLGSSTAKTRGGASAVDAAAR
jgi:hypothetical protein